MAFKMNGFSAFTKKTDKKVEYLPLQKGEDPDVQIYKGNDYSEQVGDIEDRIEFIQNDIEDDKIDQAQVKLAALEKRATKERAFQREELEDFRYEQSRADKLFQENRVYDLTKQEVEGKIANDQVLDVTDIKNLQGIFDNQHYNEHYNPESGFFDGKALGAEGSLGRSIVFETFLDSINQGSSVSYALSMASSFKNRLPSIEKINQYKKDDRPEADQDFADAFFNGDLSIARRYKQLKDKK